MAHELRDWLASIGLEHLTELFEKNQVALRDLSLLTEQDFMDLGLALGPRRRLLKAMAELPAPNMAADPADTDSPNTPSVAAERRQLTLMFCDLVGSTELSRQLDPEDLRDIVRSYRDTVANAVARFDGHLANFIGDGVLAYFGWPKAREEQAERGVRAALATVRAVENLTSDKDAALSARIGLATGLVVVGDIAGDVSHESDAVIGETPNLAARLQQLAGPGEIVLDDATRRLTGELFELENMGGHQIKGFAEPVIAWKVTGERALPGRFEAMRGGSLTPFVGRAEELALLLERWSRAQDGEGQVVWLSGEAGIGKSRLTRMLMEHLAQHPHTSLHFQCSPYHTNTSLYPVIEELVRCTAISVNDSPETRCNKLKSLFAVKHDQEITGLALLAELLSANDDGTPAPDDPQRRRRSTLDALIRYILALSEERPLMLLLEDLHWADPTTLELLSELVLRMQRAHLFVVMTARPESEPPWSGQPHVTPLALARLTRRQSTVLVETLASGVPIPATVTRQILDKTEGIPLFVEELTKDLLEGGLISVDADGTSGPLHELAVPSSLQDSLMARLDRLAQVREVAQVGAVIGREFSHTLLARVTQIGAGELGEAVDKLIASELIFRQGAPPEATYVFKHALVQDAAYESLLNARRRQLHQTIAQTLESDFTELANTQPELIAKHYTEAGNAEKAIAHWQRAGKRSAAAGAYAEAMSQLNKCLDLLLGLPKSRDRTSSEIETRVALGVPILNNLGGASAEAEENYLRALELCRAIEDTDFLFPVLWGLWVNSLLRSNMGRVIELADELLQLASQKQDESLLLEAHHCQWSGRLLIGEIDTALEHAESGIAIYRPEDHHRLTYLYAGHDPGACCRNVSALALCAKGYIDQAKQRMHESWNLTLQLNHTSTRTDSASMFITLATILRDHDMMQEPLQALSELDPSEGLQNYFAMTGVMRGCEWLGSDRTEDGLAMIDDAMQHLLGVEFAWWSPLICETVSALGRAGFDKKAEDLIDRALEKADDTGAHWWDAELHRTKGDLLVGTDPASAAHWFDRSMTIARRQDARLLELRAATSQAALWQLEDHAERAIELLKPVVDWFTEGLDTPDVIRAKSLLETLTSSRGP